MGMGVSGLAFSFELLLLNNDFSYIYETVNKFNEDYAHHILRYLDYSSQQEEFKLNSVSHGFAAGASGAIYFLTLFSLRKNCSKVLNLYINRLAEIYADIDSKQVDKSFYGGLAGILFSLLYPFRFKIKLDLTHNTSNLIRIVAEKLFNQVKINLLTNEKDIGFAWGISGLVLSLVEYSKFSQDQAFYQIAKDMLLVEDKLIKQRNITLESNASHVNSAIDKWIQKNSLCYGNIGLQIGRNSVSFESNLGSEFYIKEQQKYLFDLTNNFTFCCGFSSLHEILPHSNIKNPYVDILSYLSESDDFSFLSGLAGYLYYYSQLEIDNKFKLFGN